jgi:twitching motility protein PilJ
MSESTITTNRERSWGVYAATAVLVISLIFVAITIYALSINAKREQHWLMLATDAQVTSQQLAKSAGEAASGNLNAFAELDNSRKKISEAMTKLRLGFAEEDLPATPEYVDVQMLQLKGTWDRINNNASSILGRQALIIDLATAREIIQENIPGIQKSTDGAIRALTQSGAPTNQLVFASRQLVLADRILRRVAEVLQGGSNAVSAADNLRTDRDLFERVLNALLQGESSLGISRVRNAQALVALGEVNTLYQIIQPQIEIILNSSGDLFTVRGAADEIFLDSSDAFNHANDLKTAIGEWAETRIWPSQTLAGVGLALMIAMVWILVHSILSAERRRAKSAARDNAKNQQAILVLLDEMSSLADGDLTVQATVTEEITGAIADAVNFAIEQLRELVKGIKYTAQEVAGSAMATRASTSDLAKAAAEQAEQVGRASTNVKKMAQSFEDMAARSRESSIVAQRSVEIAHAGGEKVRETINGMDIIREQIQQTAKRIKRLGESSQEIGDIVELINGIAEQTNVLALNAAIQAASAGGAGKGFAVVADEVQQLAERATNATRRIETLVQTIQADTSEAVISMEATTSEVVSGARLAQDAGSALEEIETVSKDLSGLIAGIAEEAHSQSQTTTEITNLMKRVQKVSEQASVGSAEAATSVENLAELVMELSDSVTDFKLPEGD